MRKYRQGAKSAQFFEFTRLKGKIARFTGISGKMGVLTAFFRNLGGVVGLWRRRFLKTLYIDMVFDGFLYPKFKDIISYNKTARERLYYSMA